MNNGNGALKVVTLTSGKRIVMEGNQPRLDLNPDTIAAERSPPSNYGRGWSKKDVRALKQMLAEEMDLPAICLSLGRSVGGVTKKIREIGLLDLIRNVDVPQSPPTFNAGRGRRTYGIQHTTGWSDSKALDSIWRALECIDDHFRGDSSPSVLKELLCEMKQMNETLTRLAKAWE